MSDIGLHGPHLIDSAGQFTHGDHRVTKKAVALIRRFRWTDLNAAISDRRTAGSSGTDSAQTGKCLRAAKYGRAIDAEELLRGFDRGLGGLTIEFEE